MKIIRSEEELTNKYIHANGAETAIKLMPSGQFKNGSLEFLDRGKYSIVISCSAGCRMSCGFCHITQKKIPYRELQHFEIVENVKEALKAEYEANPGISDKWVKLCWMGMGDPLWMSELVNIMTQEILDYILERGYACGLDGVDLSTVYPRNIDPWVFPLYELNSVLSRYSRNPNASGSPFRLFYSLQSSVEDRRELLIPGAEPLEVAIPALKFFKEQSGIDVIFHHMFMDVVNDDETLVSFFRDYGLGDFELRILRVNPIGRFRESPHFEDIVIMLRGKFPRLKIQYSAGSDISSACGQFIGAEC